MIDTTHPSPLLALPAELRVHILEYVLTQHPNAGSTPSGEQCTEGFSGLLLDRNYSSSSQLSVLLTCRQLRHDFTALAFRKTTFVVTDKQSPLDTLFHPLQQHQIENLRKIAIVTCDRRLRELVQWTKWPFNMEHVQLDELTIFLHRSAHWHYPSDYTRDLVSLLRRLQNVKVLRFVRNGANVKGSFRTWFNRLVGLILKEDHFGRYDAPDAPNLEATWWEWSFDYAENYFELIALPPKPLVEEAEYIEFVAPMVARLMRDMESEEVESGPNTT